jgi:hypothetical protein
MASPLADDLDVNSVHQLVRDVSVTQSVECNSSDALTLHLQPTGLIGRFMSTRLSPL